MEAGNPGTTSRRAQRSQFDDPCYRLLLIRQQPESRPIVSTRATLMCKVSARRRYVRFGYRRNNYCDCGGCVAHPSHVIRLGVQSSWSEVGPVAVPRSSVGVRAPGTRDSSSSGMSYSECRFRSRSRDTRRCDRRVRRSGIAGRPGMPSAVDS